MLVSFLTWFLVGLLPIVLVVIIQNLIGKLLTPIALSNKGSRGVYLATAAIGVPIHELSHAIAAFLFRHRITKIKFLNTLLGMAAWDTSSINGTCCHRCKMSGFSLLVLLL